MKKQTLIIVGLLSTVSVLGQQVISTSGQTHSAGPLIISQTVGETVTATVSNGIILTQGFHQYVLMLTSINEQDANIVVTVFPNPFAQRITISGEAELGTVEAYSLTGAVLHSAQIQHGTTNTELDLSHLSAGQYLLRVQGKNNQVTNTYSIIKQ